ncbi:MAG TPA: GxxExxY protein [Verrucomicrobiota bacterium]|nr:GxxExxY protein [Verrucomicrobiota bacterium]HNT15507.1 GxxExxY protein [Verrucomicrobiota bacterium]
MPIHCPVQIKPLDGAAFEGLDYRIMGHAYASQNELGRLCNESAYQADLKARLVSDGFCSVWTEVPLTVTHREFSKRYYLDLVADDAVYELKTDAALGSEHEAQLLNYLFLLGIPRGKLLNLRPAKVQGKILATSLTPEARRSFTNIAGRWQDLTPACVILRKTLCDLLQDWGAFLAVELYQEALIHFMGGAAKIEQHVNLSRSGIDLGGQRMMVHSPGTAFRLTAVTEGQQHVESHLRRLLALTSLKAIQWINLNHAKIEFVTIQLKARE